MPIADFVRCSRTDLWSILDTDDGSKSERWFRAKRISTIELSKLGEMLGVATQDELSRGFKLVGDPRDDGPWPVSVPPSLIERLRTLSEADISSVVISWKDIEEFHGTASTESLAEYLTRLGDYLKQGPGEFFLVNAL